MKFCSRCGHTVVFKDVVDDHRQRYVCEACDTIHYENPRVITGVIPIYQGQILLAKRAIEPRAGYWNLPAGFMENGETLEEGAAREFYEETNAKVQIDYLHCVYSVPRINQVHMHFVGTVHKKSWSLTPESSEIALFEERNIPWADMAFPSNHFSLKHYFNNLKTSSRTVHLGQWKGPRSGHQ